LHILNISICEIRLGNTAIYHPCDIPKAEIIELFLRAYFYPGYRLKVTLF
jgi:hypothetical protein